MTRDRESLIDRATFLRRAAAAFALTLVPPLVTPKVSRATTLSIPPANTRGLTFRSVNYDTGTDYENPLGGALGSSSSRAYWNDEVMRHEVRTIASELHCNSINICGSDIYRLTDTARVALDEGLQVWIQPRLFDRPQSEILTALADMGAIAEKLRLDSDKVIFNVGAELSLFAPGILPGKYYTDRDPIQYFKDPTVPPKLNAFLAQALASARSTFNGPVTYGSGLWEVRIDWSNFDIVGVDAYRVGANAATYVQFLESFKKWNKPIAITEFGCETYEGADLNSGDIVNWSSTPPQLKPGHVRSEETQAAYLIDLLNIFEQQNLYAAAIWEFIDPGSPYSTSPQFDLDTGSYAIVKVIPEIYGDNSSPYHWKRKLAFDAVAQRYAAATQ